MSVRKGNKNFHTIYDDKTLENMKRYYGIDTDDELVKYIKGNRLMGLDEGDIMHNQKVNKKS
ncbi:hypothetical protein BH18THE2_BH18THE2_32890 [soil metagenome]